MTTALLIPYPGALLREAITRAGYRPMLDDRRLASDLDAAASDEVDSTTTERLESLVDACLELLEQDAGVHWAELFEGLWTDAVSTFAYVARSIDTTCLPPNADEWVHGALAVPFLGKIGRALFAHAPAPGPMRELWWDRPLEAWLALAAGELSLTLDEVADRLVDHVDASESTRRRWRSGEPTRIVAGARRRGAAADRVRYRALVLDVARELTEAPRGRSAIDRLTGWFVAALAWQSLPRSLRADVKAHAESTDNDAWTPDYARRILSAEGFDRNDPYATSVRVEQDQQMIKWIADGTFTAESLRRILKDAPAAAERTVPWERAFVALLSERVAIRVAILEERDGEAHAALEHAIERAWWRAGWQQRPLLEDGLLHAVGTGRVNAAKRRLCRLRLLVPDEYPATLDAQTRRRLAMAFEQRYPNRTATERVPPPLEIVDMSRAYAPGKGDVENPNARRRRAGGRTRRTPLMEAIAFGQLADVIRLLDAGGDADEYVPESGESALSWALRRAARDAEGRAILEGLLDHGVSLETLNRPVSTDRETPLLLAIDLDDAAIVRRLIELGACPEPPGVAVGATRQSPLDRALARWRLARSSIDDAMTAGWLTGAEPSRLDAQHGAISCSGAADARSSSFAQLQNSPEKAAIAAKVREHLRPDAAGCRAVLKTLLAHGADPNRPFTKPGRRFLRWTPTLQWAAWGDLETLRLLIDNRGDPDLTLRPETTAFERYDALYLAMRGGHTGVVKFLQDRRARSSATRTAPGS